jgi:hypothetical protein
MKNWDLLRSLHDRGETTTTLATKIGSCQSHVSQTLANDPGRGARTRKKLAPLLTEQELELAGWNADGTLKAKAEKQVSSVPHGTLSQLELTTKTEPGDGAQKGEKAG